MNDMKRGVAWANVIARAWREEEFKSRLVNEPRAVLAGEGIEVPDGVYLRVIEDSETERTLVLPPAPSDEELSDEVLEQVAAAGVCTCGWC